MMMGERVFGVVGAVQGLFAGTVSSLGVRWGCAVQGLFAGTVSSLGVCWGCAVAMSVQEMEWGGGQVMTVTKERAMGVDWGWLELVIVLETS